MRLNMNAKISLWIIVGEKQVQRITHKGIINAKKLIAKCQCGVEKHFWPYQLKDGKSIGCKECYYKILRSNIGSKNPAFNHGKTGTPTYRIWAGIKSRCYDNNCTVYRWYGEKGIIMCERWLKFENFLSDMGERPADYQIDRIDSNGNYEPSNCRWVTRKENIKNITRIDNMPGKIFGKWLVLKRVDHKPGHWYYLCRCICGTELIKNGGDLRRRPSACLRCSRISRRNKKHIIKMPFNAV